MAIWRYQPYSELRAGWSRADTRQLIRARFIILERYIFSFSYERLIPLCRPQPQARDCSGSLTFAFCSYVAVLLIDSFLARFLAAKSNKSFSSGSLFFVYVGTKKGPILPTQLAECSLWWDWDC